MKGSEADMAGGLPRTRAVVFIILLGAISLFADMTYEGARSITGPYLGALGVTATTIGIVAGLGELVGYAVRLGSGYLADASGRYWAQIRPSHYGRGQPPTCCGEKTPPKSRAEIEVLVDLPPCTRHAAGSLRFTNSCGRTWRAPSRHPSSRRCRGK